LKDALTQQKSRKNRENAPFKTGTGFAIYKVSNKVSKKEDYNMAKKSLVALVKGTDIQENVTKVFDLMGGVENVIRKGSTVVLKPNAGHAEPPETSVCTNPEVVRAVIREVKKANPKRIIVAEAAAIGCASA
jgi:uncharacterized protein (DUF362 family)